MLASADSQIFYTSQDWSAILPEVSIAVLVLVVLLAATLAPCCKRLPSLLSIGGLFVLTIGFVGWFTCQGIPFIGEFSFGGLLGHSAFSQWMRLFFAVTGIVVMFLGDVFLSRRGLSRTEFHVLSLVITGALMLLAQSNNFVMLFVSLETVTVGFYILVSCYRYKSFSLEAGLKYLILGAFSSGLLLAGIVLLYGVSGQIGEDLGGSLLDFQRLEAIIALNSDSLVVILAVVLVLSGVAFKIGAVPFQIWIPDVYQGAPSPVTLFLSVASKAAGFAILLILVVGPFSALASSVVIPLLTVFALLSILFGNLAALSQTNVKRLLGLSGVSHAGYLLMGVVATLGTGSTSILAIYFYLVAYAFASYAILGVLVYRNSPDDAHIEIADFTGMGKSNPVLAWLLLIGLGSLAGIPPLAGFIGKLMIFYNAYQAGAYVLLGVAIVGVVLSIYYYFGWIRAVWFVQDSEDKQRTEAAFDTPCRFSCLVLSVFAAMSLLLGFLPLVLTHWWN
jgi:NADH-quinone oxidoreductase subunit N